MYSNVNLIHTKQQKLTTEEIKKLKKTLKESLLVLYYELMKNNSTVYVTYTLLFLQFYTMI